MFRSHAVPPLRDLTLGLSRGQKGLFFDLFSPLGARKRALRRNCAARRVETSYLRARAERGAAGASRGRAGAEKRKSSFLGRVGTTLSRMKLYSIIRRKSSLFYVILRTVKALAEAGRITGLQAGRPMGPVYLALYPVVFSLALAHAHAS